jgi:hypothetical protein
MILALLADDKERGAMQRRGVELMATRHSPDAYSRTMDRILDSVIHKRPRSVA